MALTVVFFDGKGHRALIGHWHSDRYRTHPGIKAD
jgi:hypothetical protein